MYKVCFDLASTQTDRDCDIRLSRAVGSGRRTTPGLTTMSSRHLPQRTDNEEKATRTEQFPPYSIGFRPVRMRDLPTLTAWLAEPHVRKFYQKTPLSPAEVAAEYGPLIRGETPDICHLAVSDDVPFAYLQSYRNADYPDW